MNERMNDASVFRGCVSRKRRKSIPVKRAIRYVVREDSLLESRCCRLYPTNQKTDQCVSVERRIARRCALEHD
jgi:hypothetical protein